MTPLTLTSPVNAPSASMPAVPRPQRYRTPATCGELLQGALDGQDFMVNCPIDLYATALTTPAPVSGVALDGLADHGKARATVQLLMSSRGLGPRGLRLRIDSPIPRGKGMASSSADAGAALAAAAASLGVSLSEVEAARLLTAIEPSDCTLYGGIAHLNFLTGELIERLPVPHGLRVLVLDDGGAVETLAFDRARARAVYARHADALRAALQQLRHGLREGRNDLIGLAATRSTELSQQILPKLTYQALRDVSVDWEVLGINCAHSGTVLGLLYEDAPERGERLREAVQRVFGPDLAVIGDHRIIGGGSHAV